LFLGFITLHLTRFIKTRSAKKGNFITVSKFIRNLVSDVKPLPGTAQNVALLLQDPSIKSFLENNLEHSTFDEVLNYLKSEHGVDSAMGAKIITEWIRKS
jgi:hypothetical protein